MFTIGIRSHYEAAHFLRDYDGVCSRLHGHRYEVEAVLVFEQVGRAGIAYDFMDADAHLRSITGELDHRNLNELSAENQARYIFEELRRRMGEFGRHLAHVRVWETPQHWAQYSRPVGVTTGGAAGQGAEG
jgi:6-pyruvoyltetrahydropterin/6-carboxytetrahydropterin synthase